MGKCGRRVRRNGGEESVKGEEGEEKGRWRRRRRNGIGNEVKAENSGVTGEKIIGTLGKRGDAR